MAKLTADQRDNLPDGDFALPGGKYPIPDKDHARAALSRVSANGTDEDKAKVRAKVKQKFPTIGKPIKSKQTSGKKAWNGK